MLITTLKTITYKDVFCGYLALVFRSYVGRFSVLGEPAGILYGASRRVTTDP